VRAAAGRAVRPTLHLLVRANVTPRARQDLPAPKTPEKPHEKIFVVSGLS
jgi:hypothetical protein